MAEVKAGYDLCKDLPNEFFIDILLGLDTTLDDLQQIAALAVLHYNVKF